MKAHELAKLLLEGPDVQVILQKDSEGNGYSPLSGVDSNAVYIAKSTWAGEVMDTKWSAYDADMEPEEWEVIKNNPELQCIVLDPIN